MKPTTGGEIDSWCTKCRMDLVHRIVAMVGARPIRVLCETCGSEHNYRAPREGKGASAPRKGASAENQPSTRAPPRVPPGRRLEAERVAVWETRISGQAPTAFKRYAITSRFDENDLLVHPKFGQGYVVEVRDGDKVSVMFRDQLRLLAHGAV